MSFEEDTELRDLVIETLEKKGVLGKIKAELRATVFLALEDYDFEKCKIPLRNEALQKFMETDDGRTTVALIRNFLETFNLDYTLAVFDPEVSCPSPVPNKKELETKLHLEPSNKEFDPLLLPLIRKFETSNQLLGTIEKSSHNLLKNEKNIKDEVKTAWFSGKTLDTKPENIAELAATKSKDTSNDENNKDDNFFDDPLPSATNEPLIFSFLGSSSNLVKDPPKDTKADETFLAKSEQPYSDTPRRTSASSLSSLQDLPTLGLGSKTTKKNLDYEDDFQSSIRGRFVKTGIVFERDSTPLRGGEMMYILDQRLKAQNIPEDKGDKVLCDIVSTMLSNEFIEELFKPQELYSQKAMKAVFEKLVHSSIMKLNQTSMDKLYDLMTMVFKYQVYMCPTPHDLLYITLNHLDAIRRFVASSPVTSYLVDTTHSKLITRYGNLSSHDMQLLRCSILNFFQDLRIRVSVFLKEQLQHPNGVFITKHCGPIPHGVEIPGSIKEFNSNGDISNESTFNVGINYETSIPLGSLDIIDFNRGTQLGTNIYEIKEPQLENTPINKNDAVLDEREGADVDDTDKEKATKELALLAHLIGQDNLGKQEFTLNLFSPDEESSKTLGEPDQNPNSVVNIDFRNAEKTEELNKIMSDLNFDGSSSLQDNDILDLLDSAQ